MENKKLNEQELENVSGGIGLGKKACDYSCPNGHFFSIEQDGAIPNPAATCPTCGAIAKLTNTRKI